MSRALRQVIALIRWNFGSLPGRVMPAMVAMCGFFGVVLVFVGILSIRDGFATAMRNSDSPNIAYVFGNDGALSHDEIATIRQAPGVELGPRGALAVGTYHVTARMGMPWRNSIGSVNLRGVPPSIGDIWTDFHVIAGRMFRPGLDEIIVGRQAARVFPGLAIGKTFDLNRRRWKVVGIFGKGDGVRESEIWTDVNQLQEAYNASGAYNEAIVRLRSPAAFSAFKSWVERNPQLSVTTSRADQYWRRSAGNLDAPIALIGGVVTLLMAVGAVFGAINTMYASVEDRAREIATLRGLGFSRTPLVFAVLLEGLLLGIAGGALAALLAYAAFNNYEATTTANDAILVFGFSVSRNLIFSALLIAMIMGLIGGVLPAFGAARVSVAQALRDL